MFSWTEEACLRNDADRCPLPVVNHITALLPQYIPHEASVKGGLFTENSFGPASLIHAPSGIYRKIFRPMQHGLVSGHGTFLH